MLFEKLNVKARTVREGVDLSTLDFKPLRDFIGETIMVDGFFFTEGKFGKQVVLVGNGSKVNLPSRYVKQFEEVLENPEMLQGVLDGKMLITNIKSAVTRNGSTTTFEFATKE